MLPLHSTSSVKRSLCAFVTAASLLLPSAAAVAGTIVEWGGRYVSAYTPFSGPEETQGTGTYRRYSFTTPIAVAGVKFYGATSLFSSSGTTPPTYDPNLYGVRMGSGSNNDSISFSAKPTEGLLTMRNLLFIKKEDFLNGAKDAVVTFDAESALKLNVTSSIGSLRQIRCAVYALVNGEWSWYVSFNAKAGTALHSFGNLADEKWAPLSLSESTLAIDPPGSYSFTGSAFEDIAAIGIFMNYEQSDPAKTVGLYFNSLQVDAHFSPIPEASTVGMILLGSGLLLAGRRVSRK